MIVVGAAGFSFSNKMNASAIHMVSLGDILTEEGYAISYWPPMSGQDESSVPAAKGGIGQALKKTIKAALSGAANDIADTRYHSGLRPISDVNKPDWVLEYLTYGSRAGADYCREHGLPLVLIYDSPLGEQFEDLRGRKNKYADEYDRNERDSVQAADLIMCYSESVRKYLVKTFGVPEERIAILPAICHSNFTSEARSDGEELHIGFVGSFLKWHDVHMLVDVFNEITKDHDHLRLDLIGMGEEWRTVKDLVDKLDLSNLVSMPGYLTGSELQAAIGRLDIGVVPGSNWYGSPMKIYEYGALGIPVIAPTMPTIVDSFTDQEIVYFENGDRVQFKEALLQLVNSEEVRKGFGDRIRQRVEKDYSKTAFTNRLKGILAEWKR